MLFLAIVVLATSCATRVDPSEAGFAISNSGTYRGLDSLPLLTGWQWYTPGFTRIITIPTTQQHVVWSEDKNEGNAKDEAITIACNGGAGFKMDVGLNYRVDATKASKIYLKYRSSDLETITQTYLRNIVRGSMQDISGYLTVDSVLNNLPGYEHAVRDLITNRLGKEGFVVDNFSILKQPIPTDANLASAIAAKIKAKQDAETSKMQLQSSIAEANKLIATAKGDSTVRVINALAEAKEITVKQEALRQSPQYIELVKAQKWNGVLPTVMGGTGGMMLQLKQ